jgi:hypothetical protein
MNFVFQRKLVENLLLQEKFIRNMIINKSYDVIGSISNVIALLVLSKNFKLEIFNTLDLILHTLKSSIDTNRPIENRLDEMTKEFMRLNSTQDHSHESRILNKKVGVYVMNDRKMKILRFKVKKYLWSIKRPVVRRYEGRSLVAKNKMRLRGKFVKKINTKKIFTVCRD